MADSNSRRGGRNGYARLIGVGFSFLMILAIFSVGGFFADRLLGTMPLFMLFGVVAGFALGLVYIYFAIEKTGGG